MKYNKANPLNSLISDEIFEQLLKLDLLNLTEVRNFEIRNKYEILRANEVTSNDAIATIHHEYKSLAYLTIRKIIYSYKLPVNIQPKVNHISNI